MKRILSFIVSMILLLTSLITIASAETQEEYYSIPVEFSSNLGQIASLDVMIKDNCVYANAEMLAAQLGYQTRITEHTFAVLNRDNQDFVYDITYFYYDTPKVERISYIGRTQNYEAPFASEKNENGVWIPLEYFLLLLNSGGTILNNVLLIDNPSKTILDCFTDIARKQSIYTFLYEKDFGYTEDNINLIGGWSHIVNQFNDLLGFEGYAWKTIFQSFALDSSTYEKKYGESLALFLCGQAQGELDAAIEKNNLYLNLLDESGSLGSFLSERSVSTNLEVEAAYATCEKILQEMEKNSTSASTYSKSYQILNDALDKKTWFSNTGGTIMEVQKQLSDATSVLSVGSKVLEVIKYGNEFANHDKFAQSSLKYFLENSKDTSNMSKVMKKSMLDYSETLEKTLVEYEAERLFKENVDKWITDGLPLGKVLGKQAEALLLAWDIASNMIPFISNGLSAADQFQLSLYALVFQESAQANYLEERNALFSKEKNITSERLYTLSQYCYLYLKSCYVAREAALASLEGKRSSIKKEIKPLIDYQNKLNHEIAELMVLIKAANQDNKNQVYGFLFKDNEKYLKQYDDSKLIEFCSAQKLNSQDTTTTWKDFVDSEDYINYMEESEYLELGLFPEEYIIEDLNGDEVPELLLQSTSDAPFYLTWLFTIDNGKIVLVNETYGYGMFRYSSNHNAILMPSEISPSMGAGSVAFYRLEGAQLNYAFQIDTDGENCTYKDNSTMKIISEEERASYFNNIINFEWKSIES